MDTRLFQSNRFYYFLFIALLGPALLINLDVHHIFVHTDESLRALIALEMLLSDEFIAPTVNGEFYYNKPPLYNWIIAASFKLFGEYSLFALRFPVVVAIFLYAGLIIGFIGKAINQRTAWFVAIATITSGRILFYDSFLGLIDIAFSVVIFTNFMLFYHLGKKQKFFALFAATYFLSAVAYLMKGLPPIVFQGLTIIAYAIYLKKWRFLFHPMHFVGSLFFLIPVGIYYYFYMEVNPKSLLELFEILWIESSKRTVTDHGIVDSLKALFAFPLENLYHFAPWTLLIAALFSKGSFRALWTEPFTRYCLLVFGLNIWVYWTSPGVHPRYLFMFLPLLFSLVFAAIDRSASARLIKVLQLILFAVMVLLCFTPFFASEIILESSLPNPWFKIVVVFLLLSITTAAYYTVKVQRWVLLGIFLLGVRIAFDWFVLPNRDEEGHVLAAQAIEVAELTKGEPLYILYPKYANSATSFMIERERNEILEIRKEAEPGNYYIAVELADRREGFDHILTFGTRSTDRKLVLLKKK